MGAGASGVRLRAAAGLAVSAIAVGCSGDDERTVGTLTGTTPATVPQRLEVDAGNVFGGIHADWDGTAIVLTSEERGRRRTVTVSASSARWRRFWRDVDRLGVWRWRRSYELRPVVPDAEGWSVVLAVGGRRVAAEGLGTYPDLRGRPTRRRELAFEPFLAAVDRLLGGRISRP